MLEFDIFIEQEVASNKLLEIFDRKHDRRSFPK